MDAQQLRARAQERAQRLVQAEGTAASRLKSRDYQRDQLRADFKERARIRVLSRSEAARPGTVHQRRQRGVRARGRVVAARSSTPVVAKPLQLHSLPSSDGDASDFAQQLAQFRATAHTGGRKHLAQYRQGSTERTEIVPATKPAAAAECRTGQHQVPPPSATTSDDDVAMATTLDHEFVSAAVKIQYWARRLSRQQLVALLAAEERWHEQQQSRVRANLQFLDAAQVEVAAQDRSIIERAHTRRHRHVQRAASAHNLEVVVTRQGGGQRTSEVERSGAEPERGQQPSAPQGSVVSNYSGDGLALLQAELEQQRGVAEQEKRRRVRAESQLEAARAQLGVAQQKLERMTSAMSQRSASDAAATTTTTATVEPRETVVPAADAAAVSARRRAMPQVAELESVTAQLETLRAVGQARERSLREELRRLRRRVLAPGGAASSAAMPQAAAAAAAELESVTAESETQSAVAAGAAGHLKQSGPQPEPRAPQGLPPHDLPGDVGGAPGVDDHDTNDSGQADPPRSKQVMSPPVRRLARLPRPGAPHQRPRTSLGFGSSALRGVAQGDSGGWGTRSPGRGSAWGHSTIYSEDIAPSRTPRSDFRHRLLGTMRD
jgi:hypothetical protein